MKKYKPPSRPTNPILLCPVSCISCRRLLQWDGMGWLYWKTGLIHNRATCGWPLEWYP